jgi:hypothetical protein
MDLKNILNNNNCYQNNSSSGIILPQRPWSLLAALSQGETHPLPSSSCSHSGSKAVTLGGPEEQRKEEEMDCYTGEIGGGDLSSGRC